MSQIRAKAKFVEGLFCFIIGDEVNNNHTRKGNVVRYSV